MPLLIPPQPEQQETRPQEEEPEQPQKVWKLPLQHMKIAPKDSFMGREVGASRAPQFNICTGPARRVTGPAPGQPGGIGSPG